MAKPTIPPMHLAKIPFNLGTSWRDFKMDSLNVQFLQADVAEATDDLFLC